MVVNGEVTYLIPVKNSKLQDEKIRITKPKNKSDFFIKTPLKKNIFKL